MFEVKPGTAFVENHNESDLVSQAQGQAYAWALLQVEEREYTGDLEFLDSDGFKAFRRKRLAMLRGNARF